MTEKEARSMLERNAIKSGASIGPTAAEYTAQWPHYCHTCAGIGGHKAGPGRLPSECPDCYGAGRCGRCAEQIPELAPDQILAGGDPQTCPACGWHAFRETDGLPGARFI